MEITATTINSPTRYYTVQTDDITGWTKKDVNGSTSYFGYPTISTASTASPVWRIRREVVVGNVTTATYADGDGGYDNIWDNRASLNYS